MTEGKILYSESPKCNNNGLGSIAWEAYYI